MSLCGRCFWPQDLSARDDTGEFGTFLSTGKPESKIRLVTGGARKIFFMLLRHDRSNAPMLVAEVTSSSLNRLGFVFKLPPQLAFL
jgi:hypothetical protein